MMRCTTSGRKMIGIAVFVSVLALGAAPAAAKSPVKMTKLAGELDLSGDPSPYILEGVASHLGTFQAYGEVLLEEAEDGSLSGEGPVVFESANGDLLVGTATWMIDPAVDDVSEAGIHFGWSNSVTFSNGMTVFATGRFTDNRPPGLIVVVDASKTLVDLLIEIIFRH
jgi:hypothetical protein